MPIPEFTEYGLLPPGQFEATKAEIQDRYLQNPNRADIWGKFEEFLVELQAQPWIGQVQSYLLDGGFTSDKAATKDIDVVLDITPANDTTVLDVVNWWNGNKVRLLDTLKVDVYPYHPRIGNDLRAYFTYVKSEECVRKGVPLDTRKGLIVYKP